MHACQCVSLLSCPTLGDPMDCSLPSSSVHGFHQARVLEWGAMLGSCWPRDRICISYVSGIGLGLGLAPPEKQLLLLLNMPMVTFYLWSDPHTCSVWYHLTPHNFMFLFFFLSLDHRAQFKLYYIFKDGVCSLSRFFTKPILFNDLRIFVSLEYPSHLAYRKHSTTLELWKQWVENDQK